MDPVLPPGLTPAQTPAPALPPGLTATPAPTETTPSLPPGLTAVAPINPLPAPLADTSGRSGTSAETVSNAPTEAGYHNPTGLPGALYQGANRIWNFTSDHIGWTTPGHPDVSGPPGAGVVKTPYNSPDEIPTAFDLYHNHTPEQLQALASTFNINPAQEIPNARMGRGPYEGGSLLEDPNLRLAQAISSAMNDQYRQAKMPINDDAGAPGRIAEAWLTGLKEPFQNEGYFPVQQAAPLGRTAPPPPETALHETARIAANTVNTVLYRLPMAEYQATKGALLQTVSELVGMNPQDKDVLGKVYDVSSALMAAPQAGELAVRAVTGAAKLVTNKAIDTVANIVAKASGGRGTPDTAATFKAVQGIGRTSAAGAQAAARDEAALRISDQRPQTEDPYTPDQVFHLQMQPKMFQTHIDAFVDAMKGRLASGVETPNVPGHETVMNNVASVLKAMPTEGTSTEQGLVAMTNNKPFNEIIKASNDTGVPLDALFGAVGKHLGDPSFTGTASTAGQLLNKLSQVWKSLGLRAMNGDKDAAAALDTMTRARIRTVMTQQPRSLGYQAMQLYRAALLMTPRVIVRNMIDTGVRIGLDTVTRAINRGMQEIVAPGVPHPPVMAGSEFARMVGDHTPQFIRQALNLGPNSREAVSRMAYAFPQAKSVRSLTLGPDVTDATLANKAVQLMTVAHTWQERTVRDAIFATETDRLLRGQGSSLDAMLKGGREGVPSNISDILDQAQSKALKYSYGVSPGAKVAEVTRTTNMWDYRVRPWMAAYANWIDKGSMFTIPIDPFPRMLFNILDFVSDYMPSGGIKLLGAGNKLAIARGDYTPIAREMLGTAMLFGAYALRKGQLNMGGWAPGEKWSEVRTPEGGTRDLGAYAAVAPILGIADLMLRFKEGRVLPDAQLLTMLEQMAASFRPQQQIMSTGVQDGIKDLFDTAHQLKAGNYKMDPMGGMFGLLAGRVTSGYLTPLTVLNDALEEWDRSIATFRETSTLGFKGPLLQNSFPWLLPQKESAERAGTPSTPRFTMFGYDVAGSIGNQMSGLRFKPAKTDSERLLDYLGFQPADLEPHTGNRQYDAVIRHYEGPIVESILGKLQFAEQFQRMDVSGQQAVVQQVIDVARKTASSQAAAAVPATSAVQNALRKYSNIKLNALTVTLRSMGIDLPTVLDQLNTTAMQPELQRMGQ